MHHLAGERIQEVALVRGRRLRDRVAVPRVSGVERGERHVGPGREGRVGGVREVRVKLVDAQRISRIAELVRPEVDEEVRSTGRRQRHAVEIRRKLSRHVGVDHAFVEVDVRRRRVADEHLRAIERERTPAGERVRVPEELVVRHVVGVGPDAEFRIVVGFVVGQDEVVDVIRARRIRRRRDRNELVLPAGRRLNAELREQPAVRERVVQDDGIAVVGSGAGGADGGEEIADGEERSQRGPRLRIDADQGVHHLHVVVGADVAVRVRRDGRAAAEDRRVVAGAHPREIDGGRGHGRRGRRGQLQRRVRRPSRPAALALRVALVDPLPHARMRRGHEGRRPCRHLAERQGHAERRRLPNEGRAGPRSRRRAGERRECGGGRQHRPKSLQESPRVPCGK